MEKAALKTLILACSAGDSLNVNFLGEKAQYNGQLAIAEIRKGRGKGGSLLLTLTTANGDTVETGTPDSDNILNITTADGSFHGYESVEDVPPVYQINKEMSQELRGIFSRLQPGQTVDVEASNVDFNGQFTVVDVTKCRGRGSQLQANLQSADGGTVGIMSHRHSGTVTRFIPQQLETAELETTADVLSEAETLETASVSTDGPGAEEAAVSSEEDTNFEVSDADVDDFLSSEGTDEVFSD